MKGDIIVALVGESGSGKSTLVREILMRYPYINHIRTNTTRPDLLKGYDHNYVSEEDFKNRKQNDNILALTTYNGYRYWITKSQFEGKGVSLVILDPRGVSHLKAECHDDVKVLTVYVKADEAIRRERMKTWPDIEERITSDKGLFGAVKCDCVIDNNYAGIVAMVDAMVNIIQNMTREFKICPICGSTFEVTTKNRTYCSHKCSKTASTRKYRENVNKVIIDMYQKGSSIDEIVNFFPKKEGVTHKKVAKLVLSRAEFYQYSINKKSDSICNGQNLNTLNTCSAEAFL